MSPRSRHDIPFRIRPMLAELVRAPFHRDGWIYEEKYDLGREGLLRRDKASGSVTPRRMGVSVGV